AVGPMQHTLNGGNTWSLVKGAATLNISDVQIHPQNPNLVVGSSCCCTPAISVNGGNTWRCNTSFQFSSYNVALDPTNQQMIYLTTNYGGKGVYKSTNGGQNWTLKSKGLPGGATSLSIHPFNPSILFVGGYGGAYITTDGADSWSLFDTNGLGPFVLFQILVN